MRRWLLLAVYVATFSALGWFGWRGRDYYALSLLERPRHPLHWELKPGGRLGLDYGIAGASLMVAMLGYSVRKRVPVLRRFASLGGWLDFHIWCGITGPLLIFLHSAGKVGGLIAIAFWSMVAVSLSGVLGRFLYAQIPRTAAGDELSLAAARRLDEELAGRLRSEFVLPDADLAALDSLAAPPAPAAGGPSLAAAVAGLALEPLRFRRRLARFRAGHRRLPRELVARIAAVARQRALLARRLAVWRGLHELFHYWHVFHKPFALLMYLFAAVHVGVAWATGYAGGGP
jgi:hypothetical protein